MIHATITIKVSYSETDGITNEEIRSELEDEVDTFISNGGLAPYGTDLVVDTHSVTIEVTE